MIDRWGLLLALPATLIASGCDLFHSTAWATACARDAEQAGCAGGAGGGGGGGAAGGTGGSGEVVRDGSSAERAGSSCKGLLDDGYASGDGAYWIDADGAGGSAPFEVYCDMDHGGWTLAGVIAADDAVGWRDPMRWSDADAFGEIDAAGGFAADMKSPAWSTLAVTQVRLENASGGLKTSGSVDYASLSALFAEPVLVSLEGVESGWVDPASDDSKFFAEIQNPASTAGVNLSQRNRCVLAMGYDVYVSTTQDDQVHGFGCDDGTGGGSGPCYNESCGDVIRDASLRLYVR